MILQNKIIIYFGCTKLIRYKIMQPTMHTFGTILPFNNESEDIKERFDNDIRKSITDMQQS